MNANTDPDFQTITREVLAAYGYTQAQLGRLIGTQQTHVQKLVSGVLRMPNYAVGVELVRLHAERPRNKVTPG